MEEYIDLNKSPNYDVIEDIMEEARQEFLGRKIDPASLFEMEFFMNHRIQEEICKGNFRTTFFTPSNRLAKFKYVRVSQNEKDPNKVDILPRWMYADEEEEPDELTE